MAKARSNHEMPAHDPQSIHSESHSDSHANLREADRINAEQIDEMRADLSGLRTQLQDINKTLTDEMRNRQRNFFTAVVGFVLFVLGSGSFGTFYLLKFIDVAEAQKKQGEDINKLTITSVSAAKDIEQIRDNGAVLESVSERLRALEREMDRWQGKRNE